MSKTQTREAFINARPKPKDSKHWAFYHSCHEQGCADCGRPWELLWEWYWGCSREDHENDWNKWSYYCDNCIDEHIALCRLIN